LNIDAYLARIGYAGERTPTLDTLRKLHLAHLLTVPFENLDIPRGVPIELAQASAYHKIVNLGRGGFCYELNGAFAWLLEQLGFSVKLLSARVYNKEGKPGIAFDHLLLMVGTSEKVIADVGFGDSFIRPLTFDTFVKNQRDVFYRLKPQEDAFILQSQKEGEHWNNQYLFELSPYPLEAFAEACHHQQTSPLSGFTQKTVCSKLTNEGRVTLTSNRLIISRTVGGREEVEVSEPDIYRDLLWQHFRIRFEMRSTIKDLMRLSGP